MHKIIKYESECKLVWLKWNHRIFKHNKADLLHSLTKVKVHRYWRLKAYFVFLIFLCCFFIFEGEFFMLLKRHINQNFSSIYIHVCRRWFVLVNVGLLPFVHLDMGFLCFVTLSSLSVRTHASKKRFLNILFDFGLFQKS